MPRTIDFLYLLSNVDFLDHFQKHEAWQLCCFPSKFWVPQFFFVMHFNHSWNLCHCFSLANIVLFLVNLPRKRMWGWWWFWNVMYQMDMRQLVSKVIWYTFLKCGYWFCSLLLFSLYCRLSVLFSPVHIFAYFCIYYSGILCADTYMEEMGRRSS